MSGGGQVSLVEKALKKPQKIRGGHCVLIRMRYSARRFGSSIYGCSTKPGTLAYYSDKRAGISREGLPAVELLSPEKQEQRLASEYHRTVKRPLIAFDADSTQAREQGHWVLPASARRLVP
jgi:hypothetical protein